MSVVCARCGQESPDGFRFCGACGAELAEVAPAREVRKTVTVLFADTVGSTALGESRDPEAVRKQMASWFEEARTILERHGGRVEKFVGDAVMAVFGIPQAHEDDALRAVRAAFALRDSAIRIGVNTGEVVTGEGETLVTGDAVNVAARLEQAAQPGEVLIGSQTRRLVRDAVECEPVEPLTVKGKSVPVEAYRLIRVDPAAAGFTRRLDSPLIGRRRELERLRHDFEHAASERRCHLFTLLGSAGVGKSRLVAEFLQSLDAQVLRGRCLDYGDGITYWPLVEVLLQLGAEPEPIIDLPSPTEIAVEARKLIEQKAAERPLVLVFDDIHWAEATFLDLVEHMADWSRDAPILLLCIARPELLELRPTWGGGKLNATTVLLEPLGDNEIEALIEHLGEVDDATRAKITAAAEGNPLFVEEMVAMVREQGSDGEIVVPPTIHALLQARLDHLGVDERSVMERGAVEGQVFHRAPVAELAPQQLRSGLDVHLGTLVRKELIRPDTPTFPGDDAFRFRHLLIRDAAYESLPKETRADLHERFAVWLEEHAQLVEQDEIVGYHFEQAVLYRRELGRGDEGLAAHGADLLARAGRAALDRADYTAGAKLLERAAALPPSGDESRLAVLPGLAEALIESGQFEEARRQLGDALASQDELIRAHARLVEGKVDVFQGGDFEAFGALTEEVQQVFERHGDELGIANALWDRSQVVWSLLRAEDAAGLMTAALEHAERARSRRLANEIRWLLSSSLLHGPMPVDEIAPKLEQLRADTASTVLGESTFARGHARLATMRGDFDEAHRLAGPARQAIADAGLTVLHAALAQLPAFIEDGAENRPAEEQILRDSLERLDALGERAYLGTVAAGLARCLADQGKDDEALEFARLARERSPAGDLINFIGADAVEARVLARRGELDRAEALASDAVARAEQGDFWDVRNSTHIALGEVLMLVGKADEARVAYEAAARICEQKGALPWAERARRAVSELE